MSVQLNHTIVKSHDKAGAAAFLADILGLPEPKAMGHFVAVELTNSVTLDFDDVDDVEISAQHYAFAMDDAEFDESFARIQERGLQYWADPFRSRPGEVRQRGDSRGVYFEDPSGHLMEILT